MVVHALDPGVAQEPAPAPLSLEVRRRGRYWMLLVWLLCAAPVVASYLTFYVIRPQSRHSYGELIEPQRPLPDLTAVGLDGKPVNVQSLRGQWLLVSVASGACDSACQQHLYLQRQLRESLGKDKDRVDWVWLIPDKAPVPQAILPALASATVLQVPQAGLDAWLQAAAGHQLADHLYLIDPLGHWMMRFPAELDIHSAAQARRDIDRVLRASESWNQARK